MGFGVLCLGKNFSKMICGKSDYYENRFSTIHLENKISKIS